jgi:hypothetical protein
MSDYVLLVGWDRATPGREQEAIATFGETVQYYTSLVDGGEIESFEPFFLEPHGGDLNGFVLLRGESSKLRALLDEEQFQRLLFKAQLAVEGIGLIMGVTGATLGRQMGLYSEVLASRG